MIAHIWEFLEVKQFLFALLLIILYFTIVDGTPITTTPTGEINNEFDEAGEYSNNGCDNISEYLDPMKLIEEINSENLYIMVDAYPIRKTLTKYFASLNNTDLLSAYKSCKSLSEVASDVLRGRIKPLTIKNGTISDTIDQRIFPAYKTTEDIYKNFFALEKWQSDFFLNEQNNSIPQLSESACLLIPSDNFRILVMYLTFDKSSRNFPRDAILIPKVCIPGVAYFKGATCSSDWYIINTSEWKKAMRKAKLVIVFSDIAWNNMEQIFSDINWFKKNHLIPICCATYSNPLHFSQYDREFSFLVFHGSNVETSTFLANAADEGELKKKLLEWKLGLDFLESHHLIAFHLTNESVEPTNSEEIFREIFDIQPLTMRLPANWWSETGLVYLNSITYGTVYAVVGFKKF